MKIKFWVKYGPRIILKRFKSLFIKKRPLTAQEMFDAFKSNLMKSEDNSITPEQWNEAINYAQTKYLEFTGWFTKEEMNKMIDTSRVKNNEQETTN